MEPAPVEKPVARPRFGWFPRWLTRPILVVGFLLTPLMAVSLTLAFCKATLLDCTPLLSDEIHYWNEIACFARAGFNGGYFVPNEHPAPISFIHFGPHGPAFPVLYGIPAAMFGWYQASGPLFNVFALMAGAGVWIWRCRPDNKRLACGMFFMATFWPCQLYIPCTMQESLHMGMAFVLAALVHPLVHGDRQKTPSSWPFLVAVAVFSLVRFTWLLVLVPWALIAFAGRSWQWRLLLTLVIACMAPTIFLLTRLTSAPYPNYATQLFATARSAPDEALQKFTSHGERSLEQFLSLRSGETLEILQHYQVVGLLIASAVVVLVLPESRKAPHVFVFLNLALIAGLMIALYDVEDFRDYRVIMPHLLLSLLILLAGESYRWVVNVAGINLIFLVPFYNFFESTNHDRFLVGSAHIGRERSVLTRYINYDPTKSTWDNTILIPVRNHFYLLAAVPPGMGVSFVLDNPDVSPLNFPPKSRYLFMRQGQVEQIFFRKRIRLRRLAETGVGTLYLNLESLSEEETQTDRETRAAPGNEPKPSRD
jgi:hypothetical protein